MKRGILTDETKVSEAVKSSCSIRETLQKLGVVPAGGNYETLKKFIAKYEIDCSHFTGQGYLRSKGRNYTPTSKPLSEILVYGNLENTFALKKKLLKAKLKEHKCEGCSLTTWLDTLIPLELHHKDGDRKNNLLDNIQFLCPNCHALTDNYRGKNKKTTAV